MTLPDPNIIRLALHCQDGVALRAERLDGHALTKLGVILCHPHPLHGGNMYSHVIGELFTGLPAMGVTTLRFNFRGTSGSEGRHDHGRAEQLDVLAAINHLHTTADPDLSVVVVGYSFGAVVGLSVSHPSIAGWVGIAPPLTKASTDSIGDNAQSETAKTLIIGSNDNFCPPSEAKELTSGWVNTSIISLPGENHFLATGVSAVRNRVEETIATILSS